MVCGWIGFLYNSGGGGSILEAYFEKSCKLCEIKQLC